MKKYLISLCSFVFCVALILTGCATVGDVYVNGKLAYFDDIAYFEGQVAVVGDYLYYANGFTDITVDNFNYGASSKNTNLSRIKISSGLSYEKDVEDKQNTSPKGIESVSSKLVGYKNQYMFALGSYLYFTSANTHKTKDAENDFSQVSIFRVKFNGDGQEELGTFKHDDNSILRAVKDGNDFYYLITAPANDSKTDVYSIKIGDNCEKAKKIVENAESVVLCDETSTIKNVIYTIDAEDFTDSTDCVKAVALNGDSLDNLDNGVAGETITLNGRVGDEIFYSRIHTAIKTEIYHKNIAGQSTSFASGRVIYNANKINQVTGVADGYMFISDASKSVMYKGDFEKDAQCILESGEYTDVLFTDGEYIYYSNATSISRISVLTKEKQTLASMTAIISGQCGYDGEYVYYFAQLENQDSTDADTNYYMYRVDKEGNFALVGKTK